MRLSIALLPAILICAAAQDRPWQADIKRDLRKHKYSLFATLNPVATGRFLTDVHGQYRKYIWRQIWPGVIADYPKLASCEDSPP
jgi:hypothetical protein